MLVEEFFEGKEYSVEYISYKGRHHFLNITEKFTTGAPHFIETGHLEPAPVPEDVAVEVKKIIEHALDTLEIKYGASHSEIKIDSNGNIKIIEIGGRMGGDCIGSDLVFLSTGIDYVKAVIQTACGIEPDLTATGGQCKAEVRYIISNDDLDRFYMLKKESPESIVKVIDICPEKIGNVTDSSNRAGCYLVVSKIF